MPTGRNVSVTIAPEATSPRRRTSTVPSKSSSDKSLARRRSTMYSLSLRGRKSKPPEMTQEQRSQLARDRFRRAVFKVKAMIRFGFPLRAPRVEEPKEKKNVHYENTYKLEPDPEKRFRCDEAEKCLLHVLNDNLRGYKYNRVSAPNYARALSTMAVDILKELELPRYKYICSVMIGEPKGQCFDFVSRSVWNASTDNMATASIKTETFFAVATVHAVYME